MSVTGTKVIPIADFGVASTWTVSGGKIVSGPTTGSTSKTVTVAIPDDATFVSSTLEVTTTETTGGAAILTAGGKTLQQNTQNVLSFTDVVSGTGTFSITFRFKDGGWTGREGDHIRTMHFNNVLVTVTYTQPDPEPPVEPDVPAGTQESHGLITLHDGNAKDFGAGLGLAVLTPTECVVTETAGGDYSLRLTHPFTPDGREKLIQPWALVRVPVPMSDTPAIDASGEITVGYQIWVVTASAAGLYDRNYNTTYPAWVAGKTYYVGSCVSHSGQNYRCKTANNASTWMPNYWTSIGNGAPVSKRALSSGTRLYVSVAGATWLTVKLSTGETGYVLAADAQYIRDATQADIDELKTSARSIRSQVFRLNEVTVTETGVQATGLHVSYDFSMEVIQGASVADSTLTDAAMDLKALIIPADADELKIYCQDTGVTVNTAWQAGISPVEAILSPDDGLVTQARARLIRDNWEFFLLENEGDDRGYRLVYGVNLTGVNWRRDFSTVVTRIIPVGQNSDGSPLYLDTSGGGMLYIESDLAEAYPVNAYEYMTVNVKVGEDDPDGNPYTVATARAEMARQAQARFDDDHADEPQTELTVTFVQMGDTDQFRQYHQLERVSLYDWITIEHPDLGLNTRAQVKGYEWDAIRQRFNKLTLGDVFHHDTAPLAGWQIADGTITARKLAPGLA